MRAAVVVRGAAGGDSRAGASMLALAREVVLVTILVGLYSAARLLAGQDVSSAFGNAAHVLRLEQWLRLPDEQHLQAVVLSWRPLARAANAYYAFAHLPVTALALVWLFLCRPLYYRWARRALVSATCIALAVYLMLPTAPPRMLGSLGFVDTGQLLGQSVYGSPGDSSLTDQYAAMPSLHVGWAVLIATVCIAASHRRRRWLWLAHPLVTVLVVVCTANHYWLDATAGIALVTTMLLLTRREPVIRVFRLPARARC